MGNSFTTGTLVVMADGSLETIESIEVGDQVLATDTETGSTAAREVEALITGTGDRILVEVVTTDGGVVVATDGHPIWEVRSQAWVEAVDLEPGDLLLGVDGELVEVADVIVTESWATVHNLTVDVDHTYSVVAGDDTILTHNCGEQLRLFDPSASAGVFHATTSAGAAQGVVHGIDAARLNPSSRFGSAFYVSEVPETSLAELAHHGASATHGVRFSADTSAARILDLTDPRVSQAWGYSGGPISSATQRLGSKASEAGDNVIRFWSERGPGANWAILDDFADILTPQMIAPVP